MVWEEKIGQVWKINTPHLPVTLRSSHNPFTPIAPNRLQLLLEAKCEPQLFFLRCLFLGEDSSQFSLCFRGGSETSISCHSAVGAAHSAQNSCYKCIALISSLLTVDTLEQALSLRCALVHTCLVPVLELRQKSKLPIERTILSTTLNFFSDTHRFVDRCL